jgi:hypothetical protein
MILISHRGNLNGPNPARENSPDYIDEAIKAGFKVEVDLRRVGEQFFLGHDYPQYPVDKEWIFDREDQLLLHLKDFEAAKNVEPSWHTFCHSNDPYTCTSRGMIWQHDLSLTPHEDTIVPLMTKELVEAFGPRRVYGICSDYVNVYNVPRGTK